MTQKSFKLAGQRTGCGGHCTQKKKEWAKEFPFFFNASPNLLPAPLCQTQEEQGLPFCSAVQDGESRGGSHPRSSSVAHGRSGIREQTTSHQRWTPRLWEGTALPAKPLRAVRWCRCLLRCRLLTARWLRHKAGRLHQQGAGCALSPALEL